MSDTYKPDRPLRSALPALALTRAGGNTKPAHASVYLLADHLDVLLAACEDIVAKRLTWNRGLRADPLEIAEEKHNLRDAVEDIRKLENTVIMRALKSRERAEDVAGVDKRFRQLAKLYVAGTAILVDAVEECHDSTGSDFATADSIPAYLRSRGLVDPDAAAPTIGEDIAVGESFLIAKRIAAGALMDLAATFLDALELHYDLFLDENEEPMTPQINRFEEVDDPPSEAEADGIGAVIDEVRKEIATSAQSDIDATIWNRLGASAATGAITSAVEDAAAADTSETTTDVAADEMTPKETAAAEADDHLELVSEDDVTETEKSPDDAVDATKAAHDADDDDQIEDALATTHPEDDEPTEIVGFPKPETQDKLTRDTAATASDATDRDETEMSSQSDTDAGIDHVELEAKSARDAETHVEETDEEIEAHEVSGANDDDNDDAAAQSGTAEVQVLTAANEDDVKEARQGEPHAASEDADEDNSDEDDQGLIITAANDDETSDTNDEAEVADTSESKSDKKAKSLIDRLSSIRSE